jgi:hypothetical protein
MVLYLFSLGKIRVTLGLYPCGAAADHRGFSCWSICIVAGFVVAIPMGSTPSLVVAQYSSSAADPSAPRLISCCRCPHWRHQRGQPWHAIHQRQDLHQRGIGPIGGGADYGREDGSSRGGERSSPAWCPATAATIWGSTPSTTLYPTSKLSGFHEEAVVLLEGRSYGSLICCLRPFAVG